MKKQTIQIMYCGLLLITSLASAEPPPGHPTTGDAAKQLNLERGQSYQYQGEVLTAIDSNAYTYIQVKVKDETLWLAAPRLALRKGQQIQFPAGTVMPNFYSRKLQMTFPSVMFVAGVHVIPLKT